MSQTVFGEYFGVTAQAVSKWERELSCPDIILLPEIARVLGISIAYLLGAE
jgi:transcriptional regulator with XRE-family HTH domain